MFLKCLKRIFGVFDCISALLSLDLVPLSLRDSRNWGDDLSVTAACERNPLASPPGGGAERSEAERS